MAKAMKRRDVIRKLEEHDCRIISEDGSHTKWGCPCGQRSLNLSRHREVSAGAVRSSQQRMACLPKGWLQ